MLTMARVLWKAHRNARNRGAKQMRKVSSARQRGSRHRRAPDAVHQMVLLPERVASATRFLLSRAWS